MVFALGFLELMDLLQRTFCTTYIFCGKLSLMKSTSELLNIILIFFFVRLCIASKRFLWLSEEKPSFVYPTKEEIFSGTYGGSM